MSNIEISPDDQVLIDLVCNRLRSDPDLRTVMMNLQGSRQSEVLDENLAVLVSGVQGFLKNLGRKEEPVSQSNAPDGNSGESNDQQIAPNLTVDPNAPADPNSDPNPVITTDPVFQ